MKDSKYPDPAAAVKIFDDENGIFNIVFLRRSVDADDDIAISSSARKRCIEYFSRHPGRKFFILCNVLPLGSRLRMTGYDVTAFKARRDYADVVMHPQVFRLAFCVKNPIYKYIIRLVLMLSCRGAVCKVFSAKKEASEWLRKEKAKVASRS